ncbi:DNA replication complex GINS protein PSF2-like isoform X2 [Hydractinia symbiolongicarpus]|uniref:DNA replication complex GINS protein PSF2-like isoform X2 n=1 Tax=Hydractinia symbiolongicarpus TaxID=13093 RepID=UPI00254F7715|nr:DNA replication complex GINS protein PSF2-like isoform X2 [Hydractinia symbiolongicarpus]
MKNQPYLTPAEIEFLAEQECVTIVPNFKEKKLFFLTGDFGPFSPGLPVDVPVWLAVNLKQRRKCKIHPPSWLDVDALQETKESENNSDIFTKPPSMHYMEIASMLIRCAPEDIPKADEVRTLIKDIWDVRMAKLRRDVDQMVIRQEPHAEIDNLTVMEMNQVRTLLLPALNQMHNMRCYVTQLPAPSNT